jgi:hypothetical protein
VADVLRLRADRLEQVACAREPVPHRLDGEVLRPDAALRFVPGDRRRDGGHGLRAHRVHGGDVGAEPVHVVVDEHLARAPLDLPEHGRAIGIGPIDHPADLPDQVANLLVAVAGLDRHVDLHAGRAAGLRVADQAERVERDLHVHRDREHVVEGDRRERVEVEEQVIRLLDRSAPRVQRMELDAAEVRDEQDPGDRVDHQVVDQTALGVVARHRTARHPLRDGWRRVLLVEEAARHAVGHPLHRQRAVA